MNLGIIGYGVVGKALDAYYSAFDSYKVWHYDIATDTAEDHEALDKNAEVVFIAVGTPYSHTTGMLDCTNVEHAVSRLTGEKVVIIKSSVMPGTTDRIQDKHPEHDIFFVPEFLNEDTAIEDYANPRRPHVIGTVDFHDYADSKLPRFLCPLWRTIGWRYMSAKQAELLKLATNAFYALKVTFAQQMFDAGMTQETLNALGEDNWIYPYHLQINHKNKRGYHGACLPKDSAALAEYADSTLLKTMRNYNENLLASQGLIAIPGALPVDVDAI